MENVNLQDAITQGIYQWLLQPYPFEKRWRKILLAGCWVGAFVTLFLFFFKPFGTQIDPGEQWDYFVVCLLFGLVTFFVTLIVNGFCNFFPKTFDEEKWCVWKELLFNLFFIGCIGCGNLLLAHSLWHIPLTGKSFWTWQMLTFAVGIFPSVFGAYVGQLKMNRRYAAEAELITKLVHQLPGTHSGVALTGDNQNETLQADTGQILFLSAADNYVQVFFLKEGALEKRMLRSTMKKMEDALAQFPQFFRCHRTYIVNMEKVEKISGNAQGYRLHLAGTDLTVPVSRNLNEELRSRIS